MINDINVHISAGDLSKLSHSISKMIDIIYARFGKHLFWTSLSGPLPNADNFFIVADGYLRNLYQVDATTGTTSQLLPFGTASYPKALAYDSTNKLLYWTDVNAHTINRYSLLTNRSTVIYPQSHGIGKVLFSFMFIFQVKLILFSQ